MSKQPNPSSNQDFQFVQLDKSIHDVKFNTKPTTFFGDAIKRFLKNKSSVAAGVIIGILTLLAVTVPVFNTSSLDRPLSEARFLPPKWPGFEGTGFMDGTTFNRNIIIDTITDPNNPTPVGFVLDAVVGEINMYDTYSNFPSPYASGGYLVLRSDTRSNDGYLYSAPLNVNFNQAIELSTFLSDINNDQAIQPNYRLIAYVEYDLGVQTLVPLTNFSTEYGQIALENISTTILEERPDGVLNTSFRSRFGFQLETTSSGTYPTLYIDNFVMNREDVTNDELFVTVNFDSGNEVMLRDNAQNASVIRWSVNHGAKSVFQSVLPRGDFRYDNYQSAFGEVIREDVGKSVLDGYIAQGWIRYDFEVGVSSFELLSDLSPLREVYSQKTVGFGSARAFTVRALISIYREKGFAEPPIYLFGTDVNGNDFFKIVFSGLGTSLLLGFLAALINVTVGMIWGSLSGYYGGWIDIAMERFTEILGGVPWIILMTLIILLLGSNFVTFLFALTLTGWIGTASLTRSQFYRYKRREYILASRTLGAKDGRLIFRHILPNAIGPIVTSSVLIIPGVIFAEASISYLGLGLQGLPSLGVALSRSQAYLQTSPHLTLFSGLIISLLLISFNLFGNGLRDAFNPSLKGVSE
jgi:ABC-type dipeptide/oligopeptide/nickel transport system permease subunit